MIFRAHSINDPQYAINKRTRQNINLFCIDKFKDKNDLMNKYKEMKCKCARYATSGDGIDKLAVILNGGKELSSSQDEIIQHLCRYTSHLANNSKRRTSYIIEHHHEPLTRMRAVILSSDKSLPTSIDHSNNTPINRWQNNAEEIKIPSFE